MTAALVDATHRRILRPRVPVGRLHEVLKALDPPICMPIFCIVQAQLQPDA
jgi:hypothetical protein